jgi:hypothetical protein
MTTIKFSFNGTDRQIVRALMLRANKMVDALTAKMSFLMIKLQQKIQQKLSGEVLQNREGSLFRSVQVQPTTFDGALITGAVTAGGADAGFAQVFETGGTHWYRIVPVDKKALAFMAGPQVLDVLRGELNSKGVVVAAVWHPPAVKRPFMSTSLDESISDIKTGLQETITGVLGEPV